MSDQKSQPTVLVKKSDGTFVRMPLDQVKKTQPKPQPPSQPQPQAQPKKNPVDDILKQLDFTVPADYKNRLRSLVQLRIKNIRTDKQTFDTAVRPYKDGGLTLSGDQAEKIVVACGGKKPVSAPAKPALPPPPRPLPPKPLPSRLMPPPPPTSKPLPPKPIAPPVVPAAVSSTASPSRQSYDKMFGQSMMDDNINNFIKNPAKPTVRDVVRKPLNMGPVDEIKYFSLVDFRRLASNPTEAANRLRQKFMALKEESYLLYLDALRVWHDSPLFNEYVENLAVALASHQTLNGVLASNKSGVQMPEVQAIINMEKTLA